MSLNKQYRPSREQSGAQKHRCAQENMSPRALTPVSIEQQSLPDESQHKADTPLSDAAGVKNVRSRGEARVCPADDLLLPPLEVLHLASQIFDQFELNDMINVRLSKLGPNIRLDSAQAFKLMTLRVLNPQYKGLASIQPFVECTPMAEWLKQPDLAPAGCNRYLIGHLFDAIDDYGANRFTTELITHCQQQLKRSGLNQVLRNWGQTSFPPENTGDELTRCKAGSDCTFSPLVSLCWPFPEVSHLVMESSCTSACCLSLCRRIGLHPVIRCSDTDLLQRFKKQAESSADLWQQLDLNEGGRRSDLIEAAGVFNAWLTDDDLSNQVEIRGILIRGELLRRQKIILIRRLAQKELKRVQGEIYRLGTSPCRDEAGARHAYEEIRNSLLYCRLSEPEFQLIRGYGRVGRPRKNDNGKVVACVVRTRVTIDPDLIAAALEREILYALVTTDHNLNIHELIKLFREQADISNLKNDYHNTGRYSPVFYLRNPSRIRACFAVLVVARLVYAIVQSQLRSTQH